MKLMSLNLTLAAVNLAETEKFYREVLLLSPQFINNSHAENGYLILLIGTVKVVFQRLPDMEAQHPILLQNLSRVPLGVGLQLEMSCPHLDDIYRMVNYYHWPISYELDDRENQRRELWLHDPNGYLLVLNEEQ